MDRTAEKKNYLQHPPAAGIVKITNSGNGKIFIGKAMNAKGLLNRLQSQLKWHSHMNSELQADWDKWGEQHFSFEIIDILEANEKSEKELAAELVELEQLWMEKLQPFGERGYHQRPQAAD